MGAVLISGDNPETVCTVTAVVGLDLDSAKGEEAARTVVIEAIESLHRFCLLAREDLWRRALEGSVGSDGCRECVGLWFSTCLDAGVGEGSHSINRLTMSGERPNCYCSNISRGVKRRLGPDEEEVVDGDEGNGWTPFCECSCCQSWSLALSRSRKADDGGLDNSYYSSFLLQDMRRERSP